MSFQEYYTFYSSHPDTEILRYALRLILTLTAGT